ncbi:MAG: lipoate--protein ligase [Spirochaetales bacterium]|nr:lipoate--protein ligase [Spirochaetales bacterium]
MTYIESSSTDPFFNLALEEYVFNSLPKDKEYFMLWQNENSIIIGKHQNTIEEINIPYVKEKSIRVARRLSGGGTVYHDLGNLNFTFITDSPENREIDLASFCVPVVEALGSLGVEAEISGRNDILIKGKKFSGNAQYIRFGRVMHHGTLMFDSNIEVLVEALNVSQDKISSKGIKSVRSRVTNISEHLDGSMSTLEFRNILREFMEKRNGMKPYTLTEEDLAAVNKLRKQYESWEWNYGRSPAFSLRKERRVEGCGKIQIFLDVKKGVITGFTTRGDYFGAEDSTPLEEALRGCALNEDSLYSALKDLDVGFFYKNLDREQLISIILQ